MTCLSAMDVNWYCVRLIKNLPLCFANCKDNLFSYAEERVKNLRSNLFEEVGFGRCILCNKVLVLVI